MRGWNRNIDVPQWVKRLSPIERAELAKERINSVAGQVNDLLHLQECNKILLYSDTVSSRIPKSFAANTFNLFTECLFRYQVARLYALWDSARGEDRESVPVVIALIRAKEVRETVAQDKYNWRMKAKPRILNLSSEIEIQSQELLVHERHQASLAKQDARDTMRALRRCILIADRIEKSNELKTLKAFRDSNVAHTLKMSPSIADRVSAATYGQEEDLLDCTVKLIDNLTVHLTGTNHSWDEVKSFANRCAKELWEGVKFTVKD